MPQQPLARVPLSDYLHDWLLGRSAELRPTTLDTYRRMIRLHIVPSLGGLALQDLTPQRLQTWVGELAQTPARGGGSLSPRTVTYAMAVLRTALNDALRLGLLEQNPFTRVRGPRGGRHLAASYTLEEVRRLDAAAADVRLGALFSFLWQTGLRIGEAIALRWQDVDLEHSSLQVLRNAVEVGGRMVLGQPKTAAGLRQIALMPQTVALLRSQRARLCAERLGSVPLVFPSRAGTLLSRRNAARAWTALCEEAGLPHHGLHALRHTNASLQLQAGVGIREIAAHLGHESPALTARVYAHVLEDTRREAARRLGSLLEGTARPGRPA